MIDPQLLRDLRRRFPDRSAEHLASPAALPPGRQVLPQLWVSDGPAPAGLWQRLRREHAGSGLWPLLLSPGNDVPDLGPRDLGLIPVEPGEPGESALDRYDPAVLLREWWEHSVLWCPSGDPQDVADLLGVLKPFGAAWPGTAPAGPARRDPEDCADALARSLLRGQRRLRIGLVRADGGAEALAACGWYGTNGHDDTGAVAAVLRSWQERFGARVVQAGADSLYLSVAAPPADVEEALPVAAEHVALCPDNVFQGPGSLADYAEELVGGHAWSFWWD
ncbi:DUF4253 domain-containing protein [Kitasatospora sp. NPDC004669]|uniref:DUF4253 domain-containing protein n=1 Tax=Kitasatospora sp. NPDC004669 TaxID=3154555 RepID=UPI0033AA30A5